MSDSPIITTARGPEAIRQNLLINGNFTVWQRGELFDSGAAGYAADRWYNQLSNITWSKLTDNLVGNYMRGERQTGPAAINLAQFMELPVAGVAGLGSGDKVTISGTIRNSGNANFSTSQVRLRWCDDKFFTNPLDTVAYTTFAPEEGWQANVWQFFKLTVTLTTDVVDQLALAVNFRFQDVAAGGRIDFGRLKVEVGDTYTGEDYEHYADTLAKCQRYYQRCPFNTAWVYPSASTKLSQRLRNRGDTGLVSMVQPFTVNMRVEPTVNARYDIDDGAVADADVEYTRQNLFSIRQTVNAGSILDLDDWQADADF